MRGDIPVEPKAMWMLAPLVLVLSSPPPSADVAPVAPIAVAKPVIRTARRTPPPGGIFLARYDGGRISYDVKIENPTPTKIDTTLRVQGLWIVFGGGFWVTQKKLPVVLEPGAATWITFTMPNLDDGGCDGSETRLALEGGNTVDMWTTPTCTLKHGGIVKPDAALPPKAKSKSEAGKLMIASAKVVQSPTCDKPLRIEASVINRDEDVARAVGVSVHGPREQSGKVGPFELDGNGKAVHVETMSVHTNGHAGRYKLSVGTSQGDGPDVSTYNSGWYVDVGLECDIAVTLHAPTDRFQTMPDQ